MLKIRLQRVGRRNDPSFRAVVTQSTRGPKSGRNLEVVGHHNPGRGTTSLNGERIQHWIGNGAQVSDTLWNLLIATGIVEGKKRNALPRKTPPKKEGAVSAAVPEQIETKKAPAAVPEAQASAPEYPAETTSAAPPEEAPTEEAKA